MKTVGKSPKYQNETLPTIVCFSHLRWNFVFQRPQHLLTLASKTNRVIYFEEPVYEAVQQAFMRTGQPADSLTVVTPVLPLATSEAQAIATQRQFVDELLEPSRRDPRILWYYTPMALRFSDHLAGNICVYDCMDELSAFRGAPPELVALEKQLFERADIVFTGGQSLYEAKRALHRLIYPFPSSIDTAHFGTARLPGDDPADQRHIPHPRIGYFGVIDERLDTELVARTAAAMPSVHFVMIGPVVKIDEASLPRLDNLHWLGNKSYADLPTYLRHWDAGWMPFALNEATRYISPTKTPEFLAAGLPIVSTAIVDVVRTYGAEGLVAIIDADDVVAALHSLLSEPRDEHLARVDAYLATMSWDQTWNAMAALMARAEAMKSVIPLRKGA